MSCAELPDQEILKIIDPMADNILQGIQRRDYKLHSTHFSLTLKSVVTPEQFIASCDQQEANWGKPTGRTLVAIFRKEKSFSVIWLLDYPGTTEQVCLLATVALKGGRHFIDHLLIH